MSAEIYHGLMVMIRLNSVIGVDVWDIVITIKNLHGDSAIALRPAGDTEGNVRQHTTHSRPGPS